MKREDPIILYERQLTYVQAVLNRYPSYLGVLTEDEKTLFCRYFFPDWETSGHLYRYYQGLVSEDPDFADKADALLRRFIEANHLRNQTNLHPASIRDGNTALYDS